MVKAYRSTVYVPEEIGACGYPPICFGESCPVHGAPVCQSRYCDGSLGCTLADHPDGTYCAPDRDCSDAECVLSCSLDCDVDTGWCSTDAVISLCEIGDDGCASIVTSVCADETHCEAVVPQSPSCVSGE